MKLGGSIEYYSRKAVASIAQVKSIGFHLRDDRSVWITVFTTAQNYIADLEQEEDHCNV